MPTAEYYIKNLNLQPHPEGGFYRETYRATESIPAAALPARYGKNTTGRSFATGIYYLLENGDYSGFHRIKSDESWHFYVGATLLVHIFYLNGEYEIIKLGPDLGNGETFQYTVPAGAWFASEPAPGSTFSLVGCTVAPGFDFADFEMATKGQLLEDFPEYAPLISRLCR